MTTDDSSTSGRLVDRVIAEYLDSCDAGCPPDRRALVARYPSIASELERFFADQDHHLGGWKEKTPTTDAATVAVPERWRASNHEEPVQPVREVFDRGSILAGRFRIVDKTRGGMGRVYFADDLDIGEFGVALRVAIKTVPTFAEWRAFRDNNQQSTLPADYARHVSRFREEAVKWTRLGLHPHIVWAFYVLDIGAKPYLVMEYADGGDLHDRLRAGRLPLPTALNFALQFCEGMKHALRVEGLIHRDIKPANVLIKKDDILKISDFGLSSAFTTDDSTREAAWPARDSDLSIAGGGTPGYGAPEQLRSLHNATTRSDVFSFGVMLFEMLTGRRLFSGDAWRHFAADTVLPRPCDVDPSISEELSAIVSRCVEFDASRRFASFDDLSSVLFGIASHVPGALPVPDDPAHLRRAQLLTPSLALLSETYALISTGRHADAVACADRAIAIDSKNASHWINKSKALGELGDYSKARAAALEATRLNPADVHGWANLGWMELMMGNPEEGLQAARRAIGVDGGWADAWMCQAGCEEKLGRTVEALRSAEQAVRLEPHNWKAHGNLGSQLKNVGRLSEAFRSLTRAVDINPRDARTWLEIAWIHARLQSWREADAAVEFALQSDARNADAWAMRAWARWADGRPIGEVEAALQRTMRLDPENHTTRTVADAVHKTGPIRPRIGEAFVGTSASFMSGGWTIVAGTHAKLEAIAKGEAYVGKNFDAVVIARDSLTPETVEIHAQLVCHDCRRAFSQRLVVTLGRGSESRLIDCECGARITLLVTGVADGRYFLIALPLTVSRTFETIAPEIVVRVVASHQTDG